MKPRFEYNERPRENKTEIYVWNGMTIVHSEERDGQLNKEEKEAYEKEFSTEQCKSQAAGDSKAT